MLFNSFEFLVFLPLVFLGYWFVFQRSLKLQNLFIVAVSYLFYGWWDWRFLLLIGFTSLLSFLSGQYIDRFRDRSCCGISLAKAISVANILINLLILGVFKYFNFFVDSLIDLFSACGISENGLLLQRNSLKIILPVGISFYTFQALSYSIDVYRKKIEASQDVVAFLAYVSFFPQLVAGPIERATNLLPQFYIKRHFDYAKAVDGLRQMLWGFFKKIVIADTCALKANYAFDNFSELPASTLAIGALMFTIQIYCDFSGYSDIAIGTARLFGISLMQNFRVPYFARDIAEFWRRWHISLTTWFRDYLYIPLGGSRVGKWKSIRNTFIIFLVSGLWHGANWTFIVWGAYHAALFLPLLLLNKNRRFTDTVAEGHLFPSVKELLAMLTTFALAVLGWIIFRAENITQAWQYVTKLFSPSIFSYPQGIVGLDAIIYLLIPTLFVMEWFSRNKQHPLSFSDKVCKPVRYGVYIILLLLIVTFASGEPATFIYFQF